MKHSAFFLAGLFFLLGTSTAFAQARLEIGPRLGFDIAGDVEEFFLGVDARADVAALPIQLNGTFDYYFTEGNVNFFQVGVNALYTFGVDNQTFTPYSGLGVGISIVDIENFDSDTDVGLNLIGGARFGFGALRPFAQAQITFGDLDLVTLAGGILFRLGS